MGPRFLLRPLPLLLAVAFLAVAAVDLVETLREEPPRPPKPLRPGSVSFEPWEPVLDLRSGVGPSDVLLLPAPVPVGGLWSEADPSGLWALGDGAELELDLMQGGQQLLIFEGRPAGGKRPVRSVGVSVNGVDCGTATLKKGWQRWSVDVPEGTLGPGVNAIMFRLPDRAAVMRPRRALQLRRIELRLDRTPGAAGTNRAPLTVDFETQRMVIRTPGVLEALFTVDDRVDALRMRYRLEGAERAGEMTIARPEGGGVGRDAEIRRVLASPEGGVGRVRVPLHGRRGEFVMQLSTGRWRGGGRLEVRSLELVTERSRSKNLDDRPR